MTSRYRPDQPGPHTAYQVDYVAVNCGRIIAASKRRIRFKFGYTNQEALDSGKTGQEARGSEHEIAIIWSLSSGKQAIAFDQHEVYFDVGDQTKISHTFTDQRGHTIRVIAHAANMSAKSVPDPDWQQYDIIVNGVSFFRMPKIFEIGIVPTTDPNSRPWEYGDAPSLRQSSPTTILHHEEHEEPSTVQTEPPAVADLLSFDALNDAPAIPQPRPETYTPTTQTNNYAPHPQGPPQMPTNTSHQNQVAPIATQFEEQQCYAPAPTHQYAAPENQYHHQRQGYPNNYNNNNTSPNTSPVVVQDPTTLYVAPTTMETTSYAQNHHPVTPPQQEVSTELVPTETAPTTGYGIDGIKSLVNLDNLLDTSSPTVPVTQQSADARMKEANAHKSLCQLQGSNNATNGEKKPVMNQFNPTPVYQQQQQMMYPCASGHVAQQQQPPPQQQQYAQPGFGY